MRRLRPIFLLQDDLLAPPELAALDGATHERLVQAALRAARQTYQLALLRWSVWACHAGVLLLNIWVVHELAKGRGPGFGVGVLLFLLPCLAYLQWRGGSVESRLVRCALREVLWREGIAPTACFDCGAVLALEARSAGKCPACGSLLRGEVEPPGAAQRGGWRPDPFHRGLQHATELRHLQPPVRRRLAAEARAATARAPLVRTLNKLGWILCVLTLVEILGARWVPGWERHKMFFALTVLAGFGSLRVASLIESREARRQLRQGLFVERIVPASCFQCRANLAGTEETHCPYCGALLLPEQVAREEASRQSATRGDESAPLTPLAWWEDRLYVSLVQATELRHLPPAERRQVAKEAVAAARRAPLTRTVRLTVISTSLLLLVPLVLIWNGILSWRQASFPCLLLVSAQTLMNLAAGWLDRREARRQLRLGLFAKRIPPATCFHCRVSLARVAASRCPACGAMLLPDPAG